MIVSSLVSRIEGSSRDTFWYLKKENKTERLSDKDGQ